MRETHRAIDRGRGRLEAVRGLFLSLAILLLWCPPGAGATPLSPRGAPTVGRPTVTPVSALWITRAQLRDERQIDRALAMAKQIGARILFVQAVARGNSTYLSSILPAAERGSSFDALAYLVPRAREKGLEVHAWVSAFLVWSSYELPTDSQHLLRSHPQWLSYSPDLDDETQWDVRLHAERFQEGVFLKPSSPEARQYVRSIVNEIVLRYDVDGVLLDYLRYPSQEMPITEDISTEFRRAFYVDPPELPPRNMFFEDPEAILWGTPFPDNDPSFGEFSQPVLDPPPELTETPADFLPGIRDPEPPFPMNQSGTAEERERARSLYRNWVYWKADQVTKVVAQIRSDLYRNHPSVYLSATVIPDIAHARNDLGQDWTAWVNKGLVDFVVPYFFAVNTALVRDQMNNVSAAAGTFPVLPGIAVFNETAEEAAEKITVAEQIGYPGVALFSYDALAYQVGYWQKLEGAGLGRSR